MTILEEVLESNDHFVKHLPEVYCAIKQHEAKLPNRHLAIVTCMDTRLVDFLEPALGIRRGEAKIIKNAGNTVTGPFEATIRSLMVGVFELDAVKNVTLINKWLSDDEIAAIYRMNNVITVLPYMDASQSGIIPIAMEYGSPVISTDVGGLPEQLGYGKNGRLVPPGNPAALADAIIELLDNDDMRETIVNNATKALGLLDWKVLSRELIEFIKK